LQTWGKRACVINAQMRCYRESVLQGLVEDGYRIIDVGDGGENQQVLESVKAASEELYVGECRAIADAETISDGELKKLQDKLPKQKPNDSKSGKHY
jgi:hypothetical protein